MDTIALKVKLSPKKPWDEILIAELADYGFDGFEETEDGFVAYGFENQVEIEKAQQETILQGNDEVSVTFSKEIIPQKNWNQEWETHFEPVFVEDRLSILAPFHDLNLAKEINIIIHPKMSFGTGHHQTTWMMSKLLLEMKMMPKNILDMGTGTGVLAFLAEKLGAPKILGIDIEPWSIDSCNENKELNHSKNTTFQCGDIDLIEGLHFDMILANINKNILKNQIPFYSKALSEKGLLLLSGFFETDVEDLKEFCKNYDLQYDFHITKENWAAIQLHKI